MHFSTLLLTLTAASLATAQTTTASAPRSGTTCQAQTILDTCVSQRRPQIAACAGNDWACLCQQYEALLTCYDNCPGDAERFGAEQFKTQNCAAASAYGTTTKMVASSTKTSATAEATSADATRSGSASSATETGAAGSLNVEVAGGVLALVAAGFGLFM